MRETPHVDGCHGGTTLSRLMASNILRIAPASQAAPTAGDLGLLVLVLI